MSDAGLMRRALEYSEPTGLPVVSHCEELALSGGGVMHEGAAARLGLPGAPASAEEVMVRGHRPRGGLGRSAPHRPHQYSRRGRSAA
ncbi:MAG: hypothetical protein WKH64_14910 [Chloroflexia bacterium]